MADFSLFGSHEETYQILVKLCTIRKYFIDSKVPFSPEASRHSLNFKMESQAIRPCALLVSLGKFGFVSWKDQSTHKLDRLVQPRINSSKCFWRTLSSSSPGSTAPDFHSRFIVFRSRHSKMIGTHLRKCFEILKETSPANLRMMLDKTKIDGPTWTTLPPIFQISYRVRNPRSMWHWGYFLKNDALIHQAMESKRCTYAWFWIKDN